jgi:amidase
MSTAASRTGRRIRPPTAAEIVDLASRDWLGVSLREAEEIEPSISDLLRAIDELLALPSLMPPATPFPSRAVGGRPSPGDDPFNVFTTLCDVRGDPAGPLGGRRVGIKDNIDVAGVPTTNASATAAYTPTSDAAVVERILSAGGWIVGKLNMDDYASGATGETSWFGPPLNPVNPAYSAGGSSGGSGAALRSGAVDFALGGDQGGSARIPASYCGVVALKATHGLVPSHGMTHLSHTTDYVCPMARTVADTALLLGVVAGDDWRDPQWVRGQIPTNDYLRQLEQADLAGRRIGIVTEGVPQDLCEEAVLRSVDATADTLRGLGATVDSVSIPLWAYGARITQTLLSHLTSSMIRSEGEGRDHLGLINTERLAAFATKRRTQGALFPPYIKAWLITDRFLHERYLGTVYGVLHNLRLQLRRDIDQALEQQDFLITPTTPTSAPELLEEGVGASKIIGRVLGSAPYNTAPLNLSGHPALSLPNGVAPTGLPTSVQIVGRRFDEARVLQVGGVLEAEVNGTRGGST